MGKEGKSKGGKGRGWREGRGMKGIKEGKRRERG